MDIPAIFVQKIRDSFGERGQKWLADLPSLIDLAARKWNLAIGQPMPLSYNFVTLAQRLDGTWVVLKIGVPDREFTSELNALKFINGAGCVRLLDADDENFMFIMERLEPGQALAEMADDDARTQIACDVMQHLWRPAPKGLPFIQLSDWFAGLEKIRARFSGSTGPIPEKMLEKAEELIPVLFLDSNPPSLIHGDLHHFNILSSSRGWLAIDPKGVIGPPEYECGPFLTNPIPDFPYQPQALRQIGRRIAIMSERLGFPRERIRDWGFCHSILSAWWDLSETGNFGEYSLACARLIAKATI